jgi:fructose PTS system EIIBC or EIIC component
MAAGMTPPIAVGLATYLFKDRWTPQEREAGKSVWILGLAFITEGAIPYAAEDPIRVIPSCIIGSAVAGGLSMLFGCQLRVPHGGIFVVFIPGVVANLALYLLAIVIGALVSTVALFFLKRPIAVKVGKEAAVPVAA